MTDEKLTPLERAIFNEGERLIPGITHGIAELVRHRSSYLFFRTVIEHDLATIVGGNRFVNVIDLGCGVGHGCCTLAAMGHTQITGVDHSHESLEYARRHYEHPNIIYQYANLVEFIPHMPEYDYVVSRGVFEHLWDGIALAMSCRYRRRLIFDVPYNEREARNPHHVVNGIREQAFAVYSDVELFFQDLSGVIYDAQHKPENPNMIICVRSNAELPGVTNLLHFPLAPWDPHVDDRTERKLTRSRLGAVCKKYLLRLKEHR